MMKAWHCFVDSPSEGSLLVFAETRNKARSCASHSVFDGWEYQEITAKRAKAYDGVKDYQCYLEDNDSIPADVPDFYTMYY